MLTRDRPALAAKAVKCFEAQTYKNKRLVIFDTGTGDIVRHHGHFQHCELGGSPKTIGALRNEANAFAKPDEEILIHWDDDDWSHPNRIAEQVALLQASGADCVGMNEMLFWRTSEAPHALSEEPDTWDGDQAWLYRFPVTKPTIGSSLCYWRRVWERKPFMDLPKPVFPGALGGIGDNRGEDRMFIEGLKVAAVSSLFGIKIYGGLNTIDDKTPRMIARIHGGNTKTYNIEESNGDTWKRVPEWDKRVREILG